MSVRNEEYEWKSESEECAKEVRKVLEPIFNKYSDKFTLEDLHYIICTEVDSIILSKVIYLKRNLINNTK